MPRLTLALALLLVGCADPAPDTPDASAPPEPRPPEVSVGEAFGLAPADSAALAGLFDAAQVEAALAVAETFRGATTGADLRAAYDGALALEAALLGPLAEGYDVWSELDRFREADLRLPGLATTCVAECTLPAFALDVPAWQRAAAHVGDAGAVAYFDAVDAAYRTTSIVEGRLGGWPAYIEQTWDYGGYSRLGSGLHADLLAHIGPAPEGRFADELAALRADVRQDALTTGCIGPTLGEARAELVRIREAGLLADDAEALDRRIAEFDIPADAGIEAGCAPSGCTCEAR